MRQLYGWERVQKKFESKQARIKGTCFTNCQLGQNQKRNICEIFLNMARKGYDISEEDMTQTIYENYLGILGMMEMWVASQPRENRVIPLIEKGISPRKRILGLVQDENGKVLGWFLGWQATWERIQG
jgi:hypothetical protein